jgi:hypothetical protein
LDAERERQRRIRMGAIAGVAVVVVGGLIWLAVAAFGRQTPVAASSGNVTATEVSVEYDGAAHIPVGQQATYPHYPPSSGPHWSQAPLAPVNGGFYAQPLEPEQWIHNLEHGYVVVLYNCPEACPDTEEALRRFAQRVPNSTFGNQKIVVAPDPLIEDPIVALAWTRELTLSGFDEERLTDFYKRWVDTGPEQVP